jgi:arsenate reductase-like glutaredoxin family protein
MSGRSAVVPCAYNPSAQKIEAGGLKKFKAKLGYTVRTCLKKKKKFFKKRKGKNLLKAQVNNHSI